MQHNDPALDAERRSFCASARPVQMGLPGVAEDQPMPHGKGPNIDDLVTADIEARGQAGEQKYGERLKPHNGRDALMDAYQEALDLTKYLRQALYERDGR